MPCSVWLHMAWIRFVALTAADETGSGDDAATGNHPAICGSCAAQNAHAALVCELCPSVLCKRLAAQHVQSLPCASTPSHHGVPRPCCCATDRSRVETRSGSSRRLSAGSVLRARRQNGSAVLVAVRASPHSNICTCRLRRSVPGCRALPATFMMRLTMPCRDRAVASGPVCRSCCVAAGGHAHTRRLAVPVVSRRGQQCPPRYAAISSQLADAQLCTVVCPT